MSIPSIGSSLPGAAAEGSQASKEATAMSDRFMKLLVAQLQNQDPLNPMDNSQMTSQMAQLSSLQQLTKITSLLEAGGAGAGAAAGSGLSQAAAALGRVAEVGLGANGEVSMPAGEGVLRYDFGAAAPFKATLIATDSLTGAQVGSWELTGAKGELGVTSMPQGVTMSVRASDASGKPIAELSGSGMLTQAFKVSQTVLSNGSVYVQSADGAKAPWSAVRGLSESAG